MADQNITELPIKTNTGVANTDYMLGIDASEGYQILVRDVAKYIMENYNGSTLAGSAQTPKSAIDTLNGNSYQLKIADNTIARNTDLNNVTTPGKYKCTLSADVATLTHCPTTVGFSMIVDVHANGGYIRQTITFENSTTAMPYTRICSGNTWGDWYRIAKQSDIDALNGKFITISTSTAATSVADLASILNTYGISNIPLGASIADVLQGSNHRCTILFSKLGASYASGIITSYYAGLNGKSIRYQDGSWGEFS